MHSIQAHLVSAYRLALASAMQDTIALLEILYPAQATRNAKQANGGRRVKLIRTAPDFVLQGFIAQPGLVQMVIVKA